MKQTRCSFEWVSIELNGDDNIINKLFYRIS